MLEPGEEVKADWGFSFNIRSKISNSFFPEWAGAVLQKKSNKIWTNDTATEMFPYIW